MKSKPTAYDAKPEAIRRLYEVFASYPARPDMPRCEHCLPTEEVERLCSAPLTDLSDNNLHYYVWHAMLTVGDSIDFRHFLPRIFEVMLCADGSIDAVTVVGKLLYADWRRWPGREQQAIGAFFDYWWEDLLSRYPASHTADSFLCAIAVAVDDIQHLLDSWHGNWQPPALRHLAETLNWCGPDLVAGGELSNPWWPQPPVAANAFRDWLLSGPTKKKLESAFFRYAEEPFAKEISDAAQWYDWIAEARRRGPQRP